ncbi:hypothetical protein JHK87_006092 [Glycine soja]|nr:hypothetical protein JHK87_006092 [Glycine soja]
MEQKGGVLMQRYEVGRLLGQGTFAKVYHARNITTGMSLICIKISQRACFCCEYHGTTNRSNIGSCVHRELLRTVLEFKNKTVCFKSSLVHTPPIHSSSYISGDQGDRTAKQRVAASEGGTPIVDQKDGGGETACFRVFKNPVFGGD